MKMPQLFSSAGPSAGLVVRNEEVQLLALQGNRVIASTRTPIIETEPNALVLAVQRALATAALKTKKLAVAIPTEEVLIRFFSMPALPKTEWDMAVQFEARKYTPFKVETLVWDYRAVQSTIPDRLEVVFAAIPRERFQRIQEVLAAAGVQPILIEPSSLSLARLIEPEKGAPANEFVCMVDIEEERAHLAIVKDRMPYLTREINFVQKLVVPSSSAPFGQEPGGVPPAMGQGVETSFGLGQQQLPSQDPGVEGALGSMPPLGEMGGPGAVVPPVAEPPQLPQDALDPRVKRLLSELSVSMDFFLREYPSTRISEVYLFGDERMIGSWCQWLSGQLHCTVETGVSLLARCVQGEAPLEFASAAGLIQVTKQPPLSSIDFLKRSLAKASSPARQSLSQQKLATDLLASIKTPQAAICAAIAAAFLLLFWLANRVEISTERRRMEQMAQSNPDVGWGLHTRTQEDLAAIKEKATSRANILREIMDRRISISAKLDALARSLPDGIWLTGVTLDSSVLVNGKSQFRMVVNGSCYLGETASELGAIQTFEEHVKRDSKFFNGFTIAQIDQINEVPQEQYPYRKFQLNCNSDRVL